LKYSRSNLGYQQGDRQRKIAKKKEEEKKQRKNISGGFFMFRFSIWVFGANPDLDI